MDRDSRPRADTSAVKTVAKVLDILDQLEATGRPVTVSELAVLTGIHVSTAHRLLQTLTRRHYITQSEETRAYSLGPRLLALGSAYARRHDLVSASRPLLERLRDTTRETVHLALLQDQDVVEICTASSHQAVAVARSTGRRDPASCTATGKVLLAFLPPAELDDFLNLGPLPVCTAQSLATPEALKAELERIRAEGYALDDRELSDDVCCIGVPVRGNAGRIVAALSIAMPRERFQKPRIASWVSQLKETADRISDIVALSGST